MKAPRLAKLLLGIALTSLLLPSQPEPPLRTGAYVQDVTPHSAKICWVQPACEEVTLSVVTLAGEGTVAAGDVSWLRTGERRVALVSGLAPGMRYRFTTTVAGSARPDLSGSFRTPPARADAKVRFVVLGDSGGLPWWVNVSRSPLFGALARMSLLPPACNVARIGALTHQLDPEFWLHTGDVIYPRGEQRHYTPGFFLPFADVLRHAPVYPVLGNHDWEHDQGRPFLANFELPADAANAGDEEFFTFAWGPVRVVGLNTNHGVDLAPGIAYLRAALAQATEPWRIVVQHYPPWSASEQREPSRPDIVEQLVPVLVTLRVDLLFNGHDHNYQRFAPEGPTHFVVTGGGGKSLYALREHPRLVKAVSVYHVCEVTCDATRLTLRAVASDGAELDAFTIDKTHGK